MWIFAFLKSGWAPKPKSPDVPALCRWASAPASSAFVLMAAMRSSSGSRAAAPIRGSARTAARAATSTLWRMRFSPVSVCGMAGGFGARLFGLRGAEGRHGAEEQSCVPLVGQVRERPIEHDDDAIAEADEE